MSWSPVVSTLALTPFNKLKTFSLLKQGTSVYFRNERGEDVSKFRGRTPSVNFAHTVDRYEQQFSSLDCNQGTVFIRVNDNTRWLHEPECGRRRSVAYMVNIFTSSGKILGKCCISRVPKKLDIQMSLKLASKTFVKQCAVFHSSYMRLTVTAA